MFDQKTFEFHGRGVNYLSNELQCKAYTVHCKLLVQKSLHTCIEYIHTLLCLHSATE